MASEISAAEARRLARSTWPIERHELGDDPSDDLSDVTTPSERIAMMAELAETAWALAGLPLPEYERSAMPGRIIRPDPLRDKEP